MSVTMEMPGFGSGSDVRRGSLPKARSRSKSASAKDRERADRLASTIKKGFYLFFLSLPLVTLIQTVFARPGEFRVARGPVVTSPMIRRPSGAHAGIIKAKAVPAALVPLPGGTSVHSLQGIRSYVRGSAERYNVNPGVALWIAGHESRFDYLHGYFDPAELGDGGQSRGLWQINRAAHPEVTDACAFDTRCSTEWSLHRIASGNVKEWSTYRYCRELYHDCPF